MKIHCQITGHKWTDIHETKMTWCARCSRCNKWSYDMGMTEHNCIVPSFIRKIMNRLSDVQWLITRAYKNIFPDPDPF